MMRYFVRKTIVRAREAGWDGLMRRFLALSVSAAIAFAMPNLVAAATVRTVQSYIYGVEPVQGESPTAIWPVAIGADGRFWAVKISSHNTVLSKTSGETWIPAATAAGTSVVFAYPVASGAILYGGDASATLHKMTWSAGNIVTAKVLDLQTNARPFWYSLCEHGSTMVFAEYGTAATSKVYRSINGGDNWSEVLEVSGVTHIHCVGYHAGTGKWILSTGDTAAGRKIYTSPDGGTWTVDTHWDASGGYVPFQNVQFVDLGHPTKIYCSADTSLYSFSYDLTTHEVADIVYSPNSLSPTGSMGYSWSAAVVDGILYGLQYESTSAPSSERYIAITTGTSHADQQCSGILSAQILGGQVLGEYEGNIHVRLRGGNPSTLAHARITPALSRNTTLTTVEPSITNLYTAAQSECSDLTGWTKWNDSDAHEIVTSPLALSGGSCYRLNWSWNGTTVPETRSPILTVSNGVSYYCEAWVKASEAMNGQLQWATSSAAVGDNTFTYLAPGVWTRLVTTCYTSASTSLRLRIRATPYGVADAGLPNTRYLYVDCIMISAVPEVGGWVAGGGASAGSGLTGTITPDDSKFGQAFAWLPGVAAYRLNAVSGAAAKYYVRSWTCGSAKAELYYDTADSRFEIAVTDGTNSETLTSAVTEFYRDCPVTFAFLCGDSSSSRVTAYYSVGEQTHQFTTSTYEYRDLAASTVTWLHGMADGTLAMPGRASASWGVCYASLFDQIGKWRKSTGVIIRRGD